MPQIDNLTDNLLTVRDFVRYAVSHFNEADLFYGHGTFNAMEEAVFLVAEALHLPFGDMAPWWDAKLTEEERRIVSNLITTRIVTRKPAAYLLNKTYLQGIRFYVDERVIVPRSYIAELIVEGISGVEDFPLIPDAQEISSVLDLCTGSGCLAIIAAHVYPNAKVDAVELSKDAHAVAEKNFAESGLSDRLLLLSGDLFTPLENKKYDLIITNPPYVTPEAMQGMPEEYKHEPEMALAGTEDDGLGLVRQILKEAPSYLNDGGGLLCEIGTGKDALEKSCPNFPYLWLDTEHSSGEVFWLTKEDLLNAA